MPAISAVDESISIRSVPSLENAHLLNLHEQATDNDAYLGLSEDENNQESLESRYQRRS
jgi:hypothetical protein